MMAEFFISAGIQVQDIISRTFNSITFFKIFTKKLKNIKHKFYFCKMLEKGVHKSCPNYRFLSSFKTSSVSVVSTDFLPFGSDRLIS